MAGFSRALPIGAPAEVVFEALCELKQTPRFGPAVQIERLTNGAFGLGTRWQKPRTRSRRRSMVALEVTAYDPPTLLAIDVDEPRTWARYIFTVRPDGTGCVVNLETEARVKGILSFMTRSMLRMMEVQDDNLLERLQAQAEPTGDPP